MLVLGQSHKAVVELSYEGTDGELQKLLFWLDRTKRPVVYVLTREGLRKFNTLRFAVEFQDLDGRIYRALVHYQGKPGKWRVGIEAPAVIQVRRINNGIDQTQREFYRDFRPDLESTGFISALPAPRAIPLSEERAGVRRKKVDHRYEGCVSFGGHGRRDAFDRVWDVSEDLQVS